ncbi:hypothetical protein [Aneurinibacillus sp. REN35]|uniref:hypothetical protein n=1 Tax=Aneurinibacillus sp. REN35 TaxID=3237286 RepID=UPI0035275925
MLSMIGLLVALASLVIGIALCCLVNLKFVQAFWKAVANGSQDALIAAANTCARESWHHW